MTTTNQVKDNYTDNNNLISLKATVRLQFLNVDVDGNTATVRVQWKDKGKRKFNEMVYMAHLTDDVKKYLTEVRPVKPEHNMEQQMATGFQIFKHKNNITDNLSDIVFECANDAKEYALNPFRLFVNNNATASLYMVGSPNLSVRRILNPITNEVVRTIFYKKRNSEGKYFFLAPRYYRRFVVRPTSKDEVKY